MQLTAEQKNRIAAFLRKQDEQFVDLPSDARVQALGEVKRRIKKEIAFLGQETVSDAQIESILGRMKVSVRKTEPAAKADVVDVVPVDDGEGIPEAVVQAVSVEDAGLKVATPTWDAKKAEAEPVVVKERSAKARVEAVAESEDDSEEEPEDYGDRHWLGVCSTIADRQRIPVTTLRIGFIALGVVTGPIALLVYCGVYLWESYQHPNDYPERDDLAAVWRVVRAFVIAVSLYVVARLVLHGAGMVYATYMTGVPELEAFGWMSRNGVRMLTLTLMASMPLAFLSGLPLAYRWDKTLGLLSNAVLAVYAVVLSLGVSSALAGYLMSAFQEFRG